MDIVFQPMPTQYAKMIWQGGRDENGLLPERHISDGDGVPCRHCLQMIAKDMPYLCLAYRPFENITAFAETGPIFLCATPCEAPSVVNQLPEILESENYIARAYNAAERIVYGTGRVTPRDEILDYIQTCLRDEHIAFVDIRSAANNCFHCRATRAASS